MTITIKLFIDTVYCFEVSKFGGFFRFVDKIADFYDEEVDAAVEALTSMLEPLLMLFLGGSIGGLVVAMYLPIFQMAAAMG